MGRSLSQKLIRLIIILIFCSVVFFLQKNALFLSGIGVSGLFVPDAVSLRDTVVAFWNVGDDERTWDSWRTLYGVVVLFYPGYIMGSIGYAFVNVILIFSSISLALKTFEGHFGIGSHNKLYLITLLFLMSNFYISSIIYFPNKELPLIFIISLYLYSLTKNSGYVFPILLSALAFTIRDGFGIILFLNVFFIAFIKLKKNVHFYVLVLFAIMALFPLELISGVDHSIDRSLDLGRIYANELSVYNGGYVFSLLGTIFNLSLRPQFWAVDSGLYLIQFGFFKLGILLVFGLVWSLANLNSSSNILKTFACTFIFCLICVSKSPYIQPRYMFPFYCWLLLPFILLSVRTKYVMTCVILFIAVLMAVLGFLPPLQSGIIDLEM
jgi:hypothetical protein